MLKIALGQIKVAAGKPDVNTQTILNSIAQAKEQGADIIIFPEMSIPGYLLGDTWEQPSFLRDCEEFGKHVVKASVGICVCFGNVAVDWGRKGNDGRIRKYNAFFVAYNGKLQGDDNFLYPFRIKTLQPNYREFDDDRHFFSLTKLALELNQPVTQLLQPVNVDFPKQRVRVGCMLCEDGWSDDYALNPIDIVHQNGPVDLIINISSSPFTLNKNNKRHRVFSQQAINAGIPLIYVNNVGIQNNGKTVYTFDGYSTAYDKYGQVIDFCPPFTETIKQIDLSIHQDSKSIIIPNDSDIGSVYTALRYGVKEFLQSINMKKVVIGASGGIDSAVAASIYVDVLGPDNVLLVNMPSKFNSITTKDLAASLAQSLGCLYTIIPIQEAVEHTISQLEQASILNTRTGKIDHFPISGFVKENIQARDRSARILAGLAACFGGGFTCNANKSETTVGYSTLYGDHAGFLAALADLWKHQVYDLAQYLNQQVYNREVIPLGTIHIVPSAELSEEQSVDQGKGDPIRYPYHDYLFKSFVESWDRITPEEILKWYHTEVLEQNIGCEPGLIRTLFSTSQEFINDLERWWRLYSGMAVAKRIQAPPIIAISRRAFGFDHREAQNGVYFSSRYLALKQKLLASDLM